MAGSCGSASLKALLLFDALATKAVSVIFLADLVAAKGEFSIGTTAF